MVYMLVRPSQQLGVLRHVCGISRTLFLILVLVGCNSGFVWENARFRKSSWTGRVKPREALYDEF